MSALAAKLEKRKQNLLTRWRTVWEWNVGSAGRLEGNKINMPVVGTDHSLVKRVELKEF
jgi:hypothetical protein